MVVLEYDAFLSELTRLYHKSKTSGTVSLTMKRYDGRSKPEPRASKKGGSSGLQAVMTSNTDHHCIIRAKLRSKRISTLVHAKDVNKFHMAYANVLKGNMDSLKKHSKKGSSGVKGNTKKTKATQ